jgi:hypothetical protein
MTGQSEEYIKDHYSIPRIYERLLFDIHDSARERENMKAMENG